ncbi:hypothetical protein BOX15_Mlig032119g3 [Macrostomum lignano]|uniref:Tip elongation aberrant protein 1 n=1 Tax=Macrostomum lignano TaxID=282301 RepID=A0A267FVF5_9PLAT|nr:hypothetical protein BOX15_Mlig032119g3 [Macrostomum lignano]
MCVFGGIADTRGSCSELWLLDLATESWHLAWSPVTHRGPGPAARYGHSACAYDGGMYIYGGLAGLSHCPAELWRWSFRIGQWSRLRCASAGRATSPPPLAFHAATVVLGGRMLVFGGEQRDGASPASLWCYHFAGEAWSAVPSQGPLRPSGTVHHSLLTADCGPDGPLADDEQDLAERLWRRKRRLQRRRRQHRRLQLRQLGESASTTTTELVLSASPAERQAEAVTAPEQPQQQQQPLSRATTAMSYRSAASAKDSGYSSCLLDTLDDEEGDAAAVLVDGDEECRGCSSGEAVELPPPSPPLTLEDLESVPDLFSLSSAALLAQRQSASSTPSTPEASRAASMSPNRSFRPVAGGGGVADWAFTNQSMSISSFGSAGALTSGSRRNCDNVDFDDAIDDDEDSEDLDASESDGAAWSDDSSSVASSSMMSHELRSRMSDSTTVYSLGAPENGIASHCLLVWRGCVTYSAQ